MTLDPPAGGGLRLPGAAPARTPPGLYGRGGKRVFDAAAAACALVVLSPVMLAVGVLARLFLGTPVLYRQERPGLRERTFTMLKFRTMTDAVDAAGEPLPDSERLTRFGSFLRSTSLDELPELLNVLRGDMSLVGPRPLLMRYSPWFTPVERARFSVRPGITGLAQVSGRNDLPWDERIALDVDYAGRLSLALDLRILLLTVWKTVGRHGVRVDPGRTMVNFDVERRERAARGTACLPGGK